MSQKYLYSADPNIKISQLKNKQYSQIDFSEIQKRMTQNKVQAFVQGTENYHYKFQNITTPPYIVYYLGNPKLLNSDILAIVGPRFPSKYGSTVTEQLLQHAQNFQLTTISGLATGIDTHCHDFSIQHQIPTIAVLGGGLKRFLESSNRSKLEKIIKNGGLILSEFKLNQEPQKRTFPQRNRIIAGLGKCLFLPEAGIKSGSLITADFALQMNKKIYGTPNHIFAKTSLGLLEYFFQKKITPIHNLQILLETHFQSTQKQTNKTQIKLSPDEQKIFFLCKEQISLNEIQFQSQFPLNKLLTTLTQLEIKHQIQQISPNTYQQIS